VLTAFVRTEVLLSSDPTRAFRFWPWRTFRALWFVEARPLSVVSCDGMFRPRSVETSEERDRSPSVMVPILPVFVVLAALRMFSWLSMLPKLLAMVFVMP
jgi:hypothetical protein